MTHEQDSPAPEVEIAEIMRQVRRKISERQGRQANDDLAQNLHLSNTQWDKIYEPLHLPPSRGFVGRLWDVVRMRIHFEVRGYLDPMMFRQTDFNATMVRILNTLVRRAEVTPVNHEIESLRDEVIQLRDQVRRLQDQLHQRQ